VHTPFLSKSRNRTPDLESLDSGMTTFLVRTILITELRSSVLGKLGLMQE